LKLEAKTEAEELELKVLFIDIGGDFDTRSIMNCSFPSIATRIKMRLNNI